MQIRSAQRPAFNAPSRPSESPQTVVSAYIDGKAAYIEALKLDAIDRLETAQVNSKGQLAVTIDGQRHKVWANAGLFAATGLLPTALATAAGLAVGGSVGAMIGGVAGLLTFAMPAGFFLRRATKASHWKADHRLTLHGSSQPSPVADPGPERLRSLVDQNRAQHPQARQVLFLSGHGDATKVADMAYGPLAKTMASSQLDITLLDACLMGQLEILAKLSPWAGLVLASPHKVKASGMELPNLLSPEVLDRPTVRETAIAMAKEAKSTTPSFAVIDTANLRSELLPALDQLGYALSGQLQSPDGRKAVKKAIQKSLKTDGWFGRRRVDLGSFLHALKQEELCREETSASLKAFGKTVAFQKNDHSISFDRNQRDQTSGLPEGWLRFLKELDS